MSVQGISKSDNIILNSQNRETQMNRWEANSGEVKIWKKHFVKGTF